MYRIIATAVLLVVLAAVYFVFGDAAPAPQPTTSSPFQGFRIP